MDLNENPHKLQEEEQNVFNKLLEQLGTTIREFQRKREENRKKKEEIDISINPDQYTDLINAISDQEKESKTIEDLYNIIDEPYNTRFLLRNRTEDGEEDVTEIKAGLHPYSHGGTVYISSWLDPICRHYLMDNAAVQYTFYRRSDDGTDYRTDYQLLNKEAIKVNFSGKVTSAINMYPVNVDDTMLRQFAKYGFFSPEFVNDLLKNYHPSQNQPEAVTNIIADEFLRELAARRSTPEFQNIVFSIQKMQGEIIQSPYQQNIIVQGCAGSGKSMIMMHRLPILLFDQNKVERDSLKRANIYIITPSHMYITMAAKMREQLEISDIRMGTLEEYYDYCISKYPGYKEGTYGKINPRVKLNHEVIAYVYSTACKTDIYNYYRELARNVIALEPAYHILRMEYPEELSLQIGDTYYKQLTTRLSMDLKVVEQNEKVLKQYFNAFMDTAETVRALGVALRFYKSNRLRDLDRQIYQYRSEIEKRQKELLTLNEIDHGNEIAIHNRKQIIQSDLKVIQNLLDQKARIEEDEDDSFTRVIDLGNSAGEIIEPYTGFDKVFEKNEDMQAIYGAIDDAVLLPEKVRNYIKKLENITEGEPYFEGVFTKEITNLEHCITHLENQKISYLPYDDYQSIKGEADSLKILTNSTGESNAVRNAYKEVMENVLDLIEKPRNSKTFLCSPYIFLLSLYCFYGAPNNNETLLAIDEAQGIAPAEIRLLKKVNRDKVVMNLFGDVNQHFEGTKGINSWDEYKDSLDYRLYEMNANYRNISQITQYCNKTFGMNMEPVNTYGEGTGVGVHEIKDLDEFRDKMEDQFLDSQKPGISAIIVSSPEEAQSLMDMFPRYSLKLNNITEEDKELDSLRWNIITIADAKGIEFYSAVVIAGRMSRNEKYVAYTRALQELIVYTGELDVSKYKKHSSGNKKVRDNLATADDIDRSTTIKPAIHRSVAAKTDHGTSTVRAFFEEHGLKVIDNRDKGGRLWVIGEKSAIRPIITLAINEFHISGKYGADKESNYKKGWCTKTDK